MKYLLLTFASLFTLLFTNCSSTIKLHEEPIGLINNVSFKDSSFDNPNASCGFIVEYDGKPYAITAKHVLMVAKTDNMNHVDFEGELKQWKMHPKDDPTSVIVLDQLLSTNRKDVLTWDYMSDNWETYDDWLVFSIKENNSKHKPLKFRTTPLTEDEDLYAIGWTYSDTTGTQQVYEYQYEETKWNYHHLLQTKGKLNLGGLSGAPVVDKKGLLVGLVTSGGEDEETKEVKLEVTPNTNILKFLSSINR